MHGDSEAPTGPPGPAPRVPVSVGELVDLGLVDRLPAAVYTASCGDDPAWLYVSPQVEAILGCRPEELVADPGLWARCLHPEDRDRVLREEQALRRAPARGCSEYRFRRPDGRVVWVLDDVSVVPDERFGSVQRGLLYDITHRKRTEMLFAEHAAIVERIARGDDLRSILTEVAKATRRVSEDARCVIVLDELPGTGANLVVDASGPVPRAGVAGPGGTPVRGAAGRPVGSVRLLHPTEGDVDRDDDLLAWAARLVALAVDRATQDERMLTSLSLLEATLESTADGILVVDATGRIVGHNQKFRHMWQVSEELMRAGDDERVLESVLEQLVDPDGFVEQVRALYGTPEASSFDVLEFHDGRVFERFSQPQRVDGRSVGRVWSFRDMTAHRHLQDQLRTLAYRDPLTPLPNRALFTERLTAALSGRGRSRLRPGLLLLDIDDFKTVNDGLGHAAGDELLLAVVRPAPPVHPGRRRRGAARRRRVRRPAARRAGPCRRGGRGPAGPLGAVGAGRDRRPGRHCAGESRDRARRRGPFGARGRPAPGRGPGDVHGQAGRRRGLPVLRARHASRGCRPARAQGRPGARSRSGAALVAVPARCRPR